MRNGHLGMYITKRDKALFDYLFLHKIATVVQIDRDVFRLGDLPHVHRRIRTLVKHGYLKTTTTTQRGRPKFAYYLSDRAFQSFIADRTQRQWAQLKSDSPDHDVVLTDIRRRFLELKNLRQFITENAIEAELDCSKGLPVHAFQEMHSDGAAVYIAKGETFYIAIEYEDAQKAKARYAEHLAAYYVRNEIDCVIYVVREPSLRNVLVEVDESLSHDRNSKLFVGNLADVLNPKKSLIFKNSHKEIFQLE